MISLFLGVISLVQVVLTISAALMKDIRLLLTVVKLFLRGTGMHFLQIQVCNSNADIC